jgi:hypothetical protein
LELAGGGRRIIEMKPSWQIITGIRLSIRPAKRRPLELRLCASRASAVGPAAAGSSIARWAAMVELYV